MKVIIVGGGWAGCAAAFAARKAGAEVLLVEKTDMLLGTGLVGGIMCNNGRFTALEEARAMGGTEFIAVIESVARHRAIDFPGHKHAMLYDVTKIEPAIRNFLIGCGINIKLQTRLTEVFAEDGFINGIVTANNEMLRGDVFVDTTGSAGPAKYCTRYGTGCAMCILRCPTFGPRVSLTSRAGLPEIRAGEGFPQFEAMSGSCKLEKNSLEPGIVKDLEQNGFLAIPLPPGLYKDELLGGKACQQYALTEYARNLIILDTGHAKLMTPFFPLETLRTLPGFANARYADPYSGGRGNSVRFMAMAYCNDALQVEGSNNLFCAGEKTGPLVGHTEAIVTGFLAGRNAVLLLSGKGLMVLPETTAAGDIIGFMHREMKQPEGLAKKYTFSGSVYFERMKQQNLYSTEVKEIHHRIRKADLYGIINDKVN
ncbi:Glucose inhibited division protein A [Desulfotomaculum arcticum]|uniref:Glucose inhibited division protein A n=1 Tax=Desulfotruncus arcticus DSM 17038 TaxID=1121424 RepID=A0A1I2MV77_9FIRM|nr:FAD-dependent oxidoreductase [Desulfotruncus arcticus]SFF94559.1 Glucose inhibited division protein A [Desulfotomaculum arcticum] [Desulfotruncus arcticus DSM 17038]